MLHKDDKNWVVPFLLWLCITLRLILFWVPVGIFLKPFKTLWKLTAVRFVSVIPEKMRIPAAAILVIAVILIGSFVSDESLNNTRDNRAVSLFGLLVFIGVLWATSKHRAHIKWHTVIVGMLMQFIIALFVLRTGVGFDIFEFISGLAESLLSYARDGVTFLTNAEIANLPMFFMSVLPAIIFFVSIVQLVTPSSLPPSPTPLTLTALLLGRPPMVHRQIRRLLLLVHAGLRRRSRRRRRLPFHRPG